MDKNFLKRLDVLKKSHEKLIDRPNEKAEEDNGKGKTENGKWKARLKR